MPYKLKVDMPSLSEGDRVAIVGLGEFEQGVSTDITDEQALAYREYHATLEPDGARGENGIQPYKRVLGPSLEDAYRSVAGVTVTVVAKPKQKEDTTKVPAGGEN